MLNNFIIVYILKYHLKNKNSVLNRFFGSQNKQGKKKFNNSKKGKIYNEDYKKILKKAKEGDFVFLDPPYIEDHNYRFMYNKNEKLDTKFMSQLKKQCDLLNKKNVKWLMTQADTKQVRETFKDYIIKEYPVYRRGNNCYKNELLIKNY